MAEESKEDKSLRNGVIAAIIGAIALPVLAWIFGLLGFVISALAAVVRFLTASASMPRWLIGILVIAALPSLYKIIRILIPRPESDISIPLSEILKPSHH